MKKYNVICDLVLVTYDIGPSLSPFVAKVIAEIKQDTKVQHQLTAMGSILEGDWQDVMNLINKLFLKFAPDFERLGLTLKVDYRANKKERIVGKVQSIEDKL
jgi:uncharacterized protein (TIGR00106 family)